MKKKICGGFLAGVMVLAAVCFAADIPDILDVSADIDSITVEWEGDSDADSYNIYLRKIDEDFGSPVLSVDDRNPEIDPDTGDRIFTATISVNVDPDTTYEVAVTSVEDNIAEEESSLSEIVEITTQDAPAPETPVNLRVTEITQISEEQNTWGATFEWGWAAAENPAEFIIEIRSDAFQTTSERFPGDARSAPITELAGSNRYFVSIRAIDEQGDESEPTPELTVDVPVDTFPPNPPAGISAVLSGLRDVTVTLQNGNENMADFAGRIIRYYNEASPDEVLMEDIGTATSRTFPNFEESTTWVFSAVAYDDSGNQSQPTTEVAVAIEETEGFLGSADDFDGGCFIRSIWDEPVYDVKEKKNKVGVSAGYYLPEESDFEDFYGDDAYPAMLFYERGLGKYLSIELKAGYLEKNGNLRTVSGAATDVEATLRLVPVAASVNLNFPILPYIWGFVGVGPDYWYIEEEIDSPEIDGPEEWVGGYHGRAGFQFYNRDPDFKDWGAVFETNYSRIDRFGANDRDLGGWLFLLGLFYSF